MEATMYHRMTTRTDTQRIAHKHRRRPEIPIPTYTKGEERFNAISHLLGVGVGIFALVWMLRLAHARPQANVLAGIIIYSSSLILLYAISGTYHLLPICRAKRILRILDHCTIYLLIAGCYTPVALIAFWDSPTGAVLLAIEWGIAALGIALNAYDMTALPIKVFSLISYLVMGWAITIVPIKTIVDLAPGWFGWIVAGGLAYTIGVIFYVLGSKHKYMHCVWHVFVLAGSILQMIGFFYLL